MYRGKEVRVQLTPEANEVYEDLNRIVGQEKIKGIKSSFHQTLFRSINRTKELLKENPFVGNQLHERQIPPKYIEKYGVKNVWRAELADRWRMIYTIRGNQVEIVIFVMDIFNHRDYDKVFGYKH